MLLRHLAICLFRTSMRKTFLGVYRSGGITDRCIVGRFSTWYPTNSRNIHELVCIHKLNRTFANFLLAYPNEHRQFTL